MLNWIQENWVDLLAIYGGVVAICTVIVKWTPTTKDDEILAKVIKLMDNFSTAFSQEDIKKMKK